jgi:hypothetical protein
LDGAAVIEWIISLVYSIWVVSFIIDFLPSATSSHHHVDSTLLTGVAHAYQVGRDGRVFGNGNGARYPSGARGSGGMTNGVNLFGEKEERTRERV